MNRRIRTVAVALAVVMASLASATAVLAEDTIPGERRLPRDVVAYLSMRNVSELRAQWAQTRSGRLAQDESLKDFRKIVTERIEESFKEVQEKVGMGSMDLLAISQGELAVALSIGADGKPAAQFLLDFGANAEAVHKLVEKLSESAKEHDLERSEEEIDDTKVTVFRKAAEDANTPPQDAIAYFLKDTFLVVGNGVPGLRAVINRWDGKSDNVLAEQPTFRYVADKCRDENQESAPLVTWFIDPLGFARAMLAAQSQANPQAGMVLAMLPVLGFDGLKGIGGSFDMARGDFDMVSRTLVYIEPPAKGVLNAFQFEAGDQTPPRWATAEASSYFAIHWNVEKAYNTVQMLWDTFNGPGATARFLDELAENPIAGGVHLKKDLIDHLTGKYQVVGLSSDREDAETGVSLMAIEVKNAAATRATLQKLTQNPSFQVKEREFQGETVYELEVPGAGAELPMGFGLAENRLMIATDVKLLERVLRGVAAQESLADSPAYRQVAKFFPEKTAALSFSREDNPVASLLEILQSPFAGQFLGADAGELASKLPSGDELKKYSAPSGGYMQVDERGYKITSFSLKKAQE